MLCVDAGTDSVPSPLKRITSTIALGRATPETMLYPVALKIYRPSSVLSAHAVLPLSASETPDMVNAIAAPTMACLVSLFICLSFPYLLRNAPSWEQCRVVRDPGGDVTYPYRPCRPCRRHHPCRLWAVRRPSHPS